jgi:enamine deaminase RidA (YjgF/YER057c/UK114 family)
MTARTISSRLLSLGLSLPSSNTPRGGYVPFMKVDNLLFIAGQAPRLDGVLKFAGKVGVDLSIEQGQEAARICGLNILGHLAQAVGDDLDKVVCIARVAGVVNCREDFELHSKVLDGASELFTSVLGDAGRHVRIATGASSLPSRMAVEVEAIIRLRD